MKKCCSDKNEKVVKNENVIDLEGPICYCFNYSKKEFYEAFKRNEEALIIKEIKNKMKNPGCFCETANPLGKCCLGEIQNFVENVKKERG